MNPPPALLDASRLDTELASGTEPVALMRTALRDARARMVELFRDGSKVLPLVRAHARCVDQLLGSAWRVLGLDHEDLALIAVGGYGRGELHPWSDIDLMVLARVPLEVLRREKVAAYIRFLFDIGLDVGYSVRTVAQCVDEAADITTATNLMEARLLHGDSALMETLLDATGPANLWNAAEFLAAKLEEQQARHRRFHDSVHNLEPNIKDGPGGLRDIQIIGWVAQRRHGVRTLKQLHALSFLTNHEYHQLTDSEALLSRIRFGLHMLAGRREDRLLFDHQRVLAVDFGYQDTEQALAVEQFMKSFYRNSVEVSRLNELLLSLFKESLDSASGSEHVVAVNDRFAIRNGLLEVTHDEVFTHSPPALFELFSIAQRNPLVQGVRAQTIRLVRANRHLIDDDFRADRNVCDLFVDIMSQPRGITHELRRMHRYGLLGRYLPVFGEVEGQMQHDLFHAYTVDEHSLFVVGNLRGFAVSERAHEFPLCSEIIKRMARPELLYLAGLFHDIAKGRGGDHSILGAHDAAEFCLHHGMSPYDANIVSWLVEHHLVMSVTAQRKDISDPEVINEFAACVGDQQHLDCLYLLTVADIRATNPTLWNDWKDTLLKDLYESTQYALSRGLENPVGKAELIEATLTEARRLLSESRVDRSRLDELWEHLGDNYFLQADPDEIAWHTEAILTCDTRHKPLVMLRGGHGGTELFVYAHDRHGMFAAIVSSLDRQGLSILDARIITTETGMTLDSFVVVEADGSTIDSKTRELEIRDAVVSGLGAARSGHRAPRRRTRRQLEYFRTRTRVTFGEDLANGRTIMEVVATDRPGLLSHVGWALVDADVSLQNAKIATFGERAEDMFYVTDRDGSTLDKAHCERLEHAIIQALDVG